MNSLFEALSQHFPDLSFQAERSLAEFTTVKIGGPAEVFCEVKTKQQFISLCQYAHEQQIPLTIIGWGANTLIADRGIRGLVIRNASQEIEVAEETDQRLEVQHQVQPRWQKNEVGESYYDFNDLDYREAADSEKVLVTISSGASLPMVINILLAKGITGLQWFARIPATLGGAIYNNIHGGTHFISEYIYSVEILDEQMNIQTLYPNELEFGYDLSRFHHTKEIILSAQLLLTKGNVERAKQTAIEWAVRKKLQPQNSIGCVFQNLTEVQKEHAHVSTTAIGHLIDQGLHLKEYQVGGAKISAKHAAFIENTGNATAQDYMSVIRFIEQKAQEVYDLQLTPEIFFLGFNSEELKSINALHGIRQS